MNPEFQTGAYLPGPTNAFLFYLNSSVYDRSIVPLLMTLQQYDSNLQTNYMNITSL